MPSTSRATLTQTYSTKETRTPSEVLCDHNKRTSIQSRKYYPKKREKEKTEEERHTRSRKYYPKKREKGKDRKKEAHAIRGGKEKEKNRPFDAPGQDIHGFAAAALEASEEIEEPEGRLNTAPGARSSNDFIRSDMHITRPP